MELQLVSRQTSIVQHLINAQLANVFSRVDNLFVNILKSLVEQITSAALTFVILSMVAKSQTNVMTTTTVPTIFVIQSLEIALTHLLFVTQQIFARHQLALQHLAASKIQSTVLLFQILLL